MIELSESSVAYFLASRDELWQSATQDEKDFAIRIARTILEAESERRKKEEAEQRKEEMITYAFYKMRLGEKL